MLTAIVWGVSSPRPFAATLADLVPAAVDGALRDVVVVGLRDEGTCRAIADQAGCRLLADSAPAVHSSSLKGRWILLLQSGDRLPVDWLSAIDRHMSDQDGAARLVVERSHWPAWKRLIGRHPVAPLIARNEIARSQARSWLELASASHGPRLRAGRPHRD
ncbi:hypothetical protein [Aureimonas jatrophae]|uniref:hypothetical protein n=1 Tax=Aureimonas jatrophae TaxID=1166073 RepID=UPI0011141E0D|nr:hypothetical protein [Aureimonas jatrophae]MBB3949630.1 hypothetical protein [Aureimonas jatrophae]